MEIKVTSQQSARALASLKWAEEKDEEVDEECDRIPAGNGWHPQLGFLKKRLHEDTIL